MRGHFWQMERTFQRSLDPTHSNSPSYIQELHLGEENTITAIEVFIAVKALQAVMKSDLKCLKTLTVEFIGWLACVKCPGVLCGHQQIGELGWSSPYTKREECLGKMCREIFKSKQDDAQCSFRPGRSNTNQSFTHQQIFEKTWECAKGVYTEQRDWYTAWWTNAVLRELYRSEVTKRELSNTGKSWQFPNLRESDPVVLLRTRWSAYISDLAWSRLSVATTELYETAENRGIWSAAGAVAPREPSQRKNGHEKNEWIWKIILMRG